MYANDCTNEVKGPRLLFLKTQRVVTIGGEWTFAVVANVGPVLNNAAVPERGIAEHDRADTN